MSTSNTIATAYAENKGESYTTGLKAGTHTAVADEPVAVGGKDAGATPGDYLCMSLASCKAITLRMYVQRKKWDIGNITVKVSLERQETDGSITHTINAEIFIDQPIPAEQKERLVYIAKACPISKLLSKQNEVVTKVV
jgi:putative redox protein